MQTDHHMTGAELQTLREACNLSRDELATLAGVAARTVKHWENGRAGVPADVAAIVTDIDARITVEMHRVTRAAMAWARAGGTGDPVRPAVLVRHGPESWDRWCLEGKLAGLPASVSGALASRCRLWMQAGETGSNVMAARVVWFDDADYVAWLERAGAAPSADTLQRWAAEQVTTQAIPHRADQPPA